MQALAVLLLASAAEPAAANGVMTVQAVVAPACTIRQAADVVVVCAGRQPYVVQRPGRAPSRELRPEPVTVTF